jgi:hypothetical protein
MERIPMTIDTSIEARLSPWRGTSVVAFLFVISMLPAPSEGKDIEHCEKLKSGIKRCELTYAYPENPKLIIPDVKSITYTDRSGVIIDWELTRPHKMEKNLSSTLVMLIETEMGTLDPSSTMESRSRLFRNLVDNAGAGKSETFPLGKYDWISSLSSTDIVMMRASRRR